MIHKKIYDKFFIILKKEINKKESFKPLTRIKNSSKDKPKLSEMISPGRQSFKNELNKNSKNLFGNVNNNPNSTHVINNPTSPTSASSNNFSLNNKTFLKIISSKKSNKNIKYLGKNNIYCIRFKEGKTSNIIIRNFLL